MNVQKITKEVYVTSDGIEHLTLDAAMVHHDRLLRVKTKEWLSSSLYESGGLGYNFETDSAADWVIDNIDEIVARLTK